MMDEENCMMDEEEDHAIDTIVDYILERLPRAICGENYIHRLLCGNHQDLYRKVLRLDKDVFHTSC